MICWHDAEHNRPAECGDHAGVVPAGLKRCCLNGQPEGGCVMTRLYAWLWQGCASLALAVLLVGLAAWGTHNACAEDPIPIPIDGPRCTECTTLCVGQIGAPCDQFGQNGPTCSASCFCMQDPNGTAQPNCRPIFN